MNVLAPVFGNYVTVSRNYKAILVVTGNSDAALAQVWCYDQRSIESLWNNGNFGKGVLSRSTPTWENRYNSYIEGSNELVFVEQVALARRLERHKVPRDKNNCFQSVNPQVAKLMEPLQLSSCETLFLSTALGCLALHDRNGNEIPLSVVWHMLLKHRSSAISWDNTLLVEYAVYSFYRSRGWVVRNGLKFSTDFVLYKNGPQSSHSEYAVKIIPVLPCPDKGRVNVTSRNYEEDVRLLHSQSRICSQVKKRLLLCYVEIPDCSVSIKIPLYDLSVYKITEISVSRFNPEVNR